MLCGRQNLPLRGHVETGPVLVEPLFNDGNFRAFLRHRAEAGDHILRAHLEKHNKNASYISPESQNKLIIEIGAQILVCTTVSSHCSK